MDIHAFASATARLIGPRGESARRLLARMNSNTGRAIAAKYSSDPKMPLSDDDRERIEKEIGDAL